MENEHGRNKQPSEKEEEKKEGKGPQVEPQGGTSSPPGKKPPDD